MINRKSTFFLGIFIFIVPFLGVPSSWRTVFIVLSGIALIILSIKITIPKRTSRNKIKREKITPVFVESMPVFSKERTVIDGVIAPNFEIKPDTTENIAEAKSAK